MRVLFVALLLLFSFLVAPISVSAQEVNECKCGRVEEVLENAKKHEHIFVGKVIKVTNVGEKHIVNFDLVKSYKGYQNENFDVFTPSDETKCGYRFKKGNDYFVYAIVDRDGRISTGKCNQTKPVGEAEEDMAAIGSKNFASSAQAKVSKATKDNLGPMGDTTPAMITVVLAAAAVLILGVGVGVTGVSDEQRKRKKR